MHARDKLEHGMAKYGKTGGIFARLWHRISVGKILTHTTLRITVECEIGNFRQ